jgi:putative YhdH/YhfP family quinone oxidoreductase
VDKFKVFRIRDVGGKVVSGFEQTALSELDPGQVLIRVFYSSINYKDALAATGAGKIIRRFPCIGGIDMAGEVVESSDPRFAAGTSVIATSFDLGVSHDGGYSEYARVPAEWVIPLPPGLSLFESMALGTAGFTAALGIMQMELNGLEPGKGPVLVTGATGGVGSLALDMLAGRGYRVVALTGKETATDYLKHLGAAEVLRRQSLDIGKRRPLDKAQWAGAVDNLGGDMLAWIASTMQDNGTIASIGLAAGMQLNATVAPFILRGVSLLGINSVNTPFEQRQKVWQRLAGDLRPRHLADIASALPFDQLPGAFEAFIRSEVRGRIVVALPAASQARS